MKKRKLLMVVGVLCLLVGLAGHARADLIAYWPFDEGTGTVAADIIGGNDGQITGCTWLMPGKIGNAALEGVGGDKVDCGNGPTPTTDDLTISWWMIDDNAGYGRIINKSVNDSSLGYSILLRPSTEDSPLRFRIGGEGKYGGWGGECRLPTGAYNDGEWVHITCTYDSATDTAAIYVNGELKEYGANNPKTGIATYSDGVNNPDVPLYIRGGVETFVGVIDEVAIWDTALTPAEVLGVYEDGANPFDPEPIPENGDTVIAEDPLTLSWLNIPNDSNSVYVDVWFGTDPNEANATYDMSQIVDADVDATSVTVDASAEETYYWQVNSYLDGDPATTVYNNEDPNDPNMLEGKLWSFTTVGDPAPKIVDITPDQITWSGGPVTLGVAVTNDGPSETIYEWIADPAADVGITGGDTATPTVMITKMPSYTAKIVNAGFEAVLTGEPPADWGPEPPTGWEAIARSGTWNPPETAYTDSTVPEGVMCAWAQTIDGGLSQVLAETLTTDAQYVLTVEVGNSNTYDWTGYKVQLLAGGAVIAEDNSTLIPALGTFETSIVPYSYVPEDANKVGLPLEIRLLAGDLVVAGTYAECNFDDVRLTADTPFPVTTGVETVTMTVLVSDEANPMPVEASVEIDVYDDACAMARLALGADNPNDLDKDCDIDIDDLALMAGTWLNDKSIDAPAVSPDQEVLPLVINGGFQMYKPGTGFTVTAAFDGVGYTGDIEGDVTLAGGVVAYSDGTTGNVINCPGWVESAPGVGLWIKGVADSLDTGNTSMETFSNWGPKDAEDNYVGTRIMSATSLGVINSDTVYTLSGMVKNGAVAGPLTLDLLADGVVITPSSDVTPTSDIGEFQEISRTYNPADLAGYAGQSIKIEFGTSFGNSVGGRASWDNIALEAEVFDANDPPPTVDAGENMITWLGQPVSLTGTVDGADTNWDMEDVTYNWTAYPSDDPKLDVVVSNPGDLDTTVTVTKVPYFQPYVGNASFEDKPRDDGQVTWMSLSDDPWCNYERDSGSGWVAVWNPSSTQSFQGVAPEGENVIRTYTRADEDKSVVGGAAQLLDVTFDPTSTIVLKVKVGHRSPYWNGYLVQLVAGGVETANGYSVSGGEVIAQDDNSLAVAEDTFVTSTVTYTLDPAYTHLAGERLQIRLLTLNDEEDVMDFTQAIYDDVQLLINGEAGKFITDPGVPSVKMTLTVEEVSTGKAASGYASIDVYDDACLASLAADPELDLDLGDLDADCITNLKDFAKLATSWLDDYSSTGPLDRPEEE